MTLVVIDTNYFLHDLEFIKNLHLNLPSDFMIFIPYIVIQELDSLKHMIQARKAIDFINEFMNQKIRIQRIDEIVHSVIENDDRILDCCFYAIQQLTPSVYFMCNDKNLCIKAKTHAIPTISKYPKTAKDLIHEIKSNSATLFQSLQDASVPLHHEQMVTKDRDVEMIYSDHEQIDFNDLLVELSTVLVGCLSASISQIYLDHYGIDWSSRIVYPPPWTLAMIFHILAKDGIFKNVFDRTVSLSALEQFGKDIDKSTRQSKSMLTIGELYKFLESMDSVLCLCDVAGLSHDREKALKILAGIKNKLKYL